MPEWKPPNVSPDAVADFIIEADDSDDEAPVRSSTQPQSLSSAPPPANSMFSNFTSFMNPTAVNLEASFQPLTGANTRVQERQFSGGNTLDEPILETLSRDLKAIGHHLYAVLWPASLSKLAKAQQQNLVGYARNAGINVPDALRGDIENEAAPVAVKQLEWDLWGPLVFSLAYSVILGVLSPKALSSEVFSLTFSMIWLTLAVIAVNIQLLGGTISFLPALSATGYSIFPIVVGAVVSILVKHAMVRLVVDAVLVSWAVYAATVALKCSGVLSGRVILAIYPVGLIYVVLGWLCVIT
ncbi:hypothetical protein BABINDRAFT_161877 [Babjeviella inositovora NRRL Y-12698]|uniref:Protein YIP n=1 Tax=Babjeviella inositovora NRRL Y-12698 TaxID=984486 RepID=A0A1E3QP88_9ASCO|nr:uncharacterized protein BABINDRAFT_161877 [Babjeviella inositovora NRRL Y-12698]ODQ79481.1 hypothetical protein BABINDRAFT_161877 [Babjeviella inositovora NRRL Y-12698]